MREHSKRRNLNRGYMKLRVWQDAMELAQLISKTLNDISGLDFRLKGQIINAVQSVSANIAEGYCRRTLGEYLYFAYVALGSLGETLTRIIGLRQMGFLTEEAFDQIDAEHYKVENELLKLTSSLQRKQRTSKWSEALIQ